MLLVYYNGGEDTPRLDTQSTGRKERVGLHEGADRRDGNMIGRDALTHQL